MKILLLDSDSKNGFPNLALMKLSAFHKAQSDNVTLIKGIPSTAPLEQFDKVYISNIFFQNRERVLDYASQFKNVVIGGSGFDYNVRLDYDIEHMMPDYSLYQTDFSMGFTSRGCVRHCEFCIVPEKEGMIQDNAPIKEFHYPIHKKLILLDNNFIASPRWRENLAYIRFHNLKVNFNSGFDIRLITDEFTQELLTIKYYDWKFKTRGFQIAFDNINYEKSFKRGIEILLNHGIPSNHIMVYILAGFKDSRDDILKRCDIILEYGAKPYIMPYNNTKDPWIRNLARFYNRKYFEFMTRQEYNNGILA